ncbi:phage protein NinX family protein [Yokenella regensburgei]|uniref:phage protein NinX family protein n=1 Tax=Yokenella regensburgei TaxID=158877 RepID=UPI00289D01E3|nr:phage protein NinX family protein [Yokenella regensburgei]
MMDYSELSDYEVSKRVAMVVGGFLEEDFCESHSVIFRRHGRHQYSFFEPCTNPSDAWPIIESNKINVEWHQWKDDSDKPYALNNATMISRYDDNPLRAAMIVFLMMQDSANVQDNPA